MRGWIMRSAIEERHDYLRTELISVGAEILTPNEPDIRAGILTFRFGGVDSAVLYRTLMERKGDMR